MFITVLTYILMVLEGICSLLLIGVILLQRTKGQGMGMAFGGAMGESMFGANMGNVLTKTTVILSVIFLVNTTVLAFLGASGKESSIADRISGGAATPVAPIEQPATPVDDPMAGVDDAGIPAPVSMPSPATDLVIPEPVEDQ